MRLVLLGLPAAGVSTVGECLAKAMKLSFWDTEAHMAERGGSAILLNDGEEAYRKVELEECLKGLNSGCAVVGLPSAGPTYAAVAELLGKSPVVLLNARTHVLEVRNGLNAPRSIALGTPNATFAALKKRREEELRPLAAVEIDTSEATPEESAAAIIRELGL